jgi:hypothetical protein
LVGVVDRVVSFVTKLGLDGVEGRARSEEDSALGPLNSLLKGALSLGERVAEREENGTALKATLLNRVLESTDNRLGEDAEGRSKTNQGTVLDILDDFLKSTVLLTIVVSSSEVLLVLSQAITTVFSNKTLGIDEPELVAGGSFAQSTACIVLNELFGNTDTSRAGAHEDKPLFLDWNTRLLNSANISTQHNGTSSLDIVVLSK